MNDLIEYYKKIAQMAPELQKIVNDNWDELGRPRELNSESSAIIAILNKNAAPGFQGFKLDMNKVFDDQKFTEQQLATYYNVYVAGAQFIANRMKAETSLVNSVSDKPKNKM